MRFTAFDMSPRPQLIKINLLFRWEERKGAQGNSEPVASLLVLVSPFGFSDRRILGDESTQNQSTN
jgi:hypothetical protein